ncbi:hypothetical protein Pfo_007531 [Paulownia fortunei]|nr:hypothetical protein Pfo_007531 [Paulownia fortunei]
MAKVFTLAEVAEHNTTKDCWLTIFGKVYNVTTFLDEHPGGDEVLLSATGKDATAEFDDVGHSHDAWAMLENTMWVNSISQPFPPAPPLLHCSLLTKKAKNRNTWCTSSSSWFL